MKKITIAAYTIYGTANTATHSDNVDTVTTDQTIHETNSSAYLDPTQNPIYPLYLSEDADVCA
ncbi:MAG: hypothetical protein AAF617_03645 [Bacteroidota bacterium]